MRLIDYYKILEIQQSASLEEIKIAFKKQAVKWHPDRNLETDTTKKMQEINEAYLILKDKEARVRYDREYLKYEEFNSRHSKSYYKEKQSKSDSQSANKQKEKNTGKAGYSFDDEILQDWMQNARKQAVDLAKQTIRDVGELSLIATKAAGSKMLKLFFQYLVIGIILSLIVGLCA